MLPLQFLHKCTSQGVHDVFVGEMSQRLTHLLVILSHEHFLIVDICANDPSRIMGVESPPYDVS